MRRACLERWLTRAQEARAATASQLHIPAACNQRSLVVPGELLRLLCRFFKPRDLAVLVEVPTLGY